MLGRRQSVDRHGSLSGESTRARNTHPIETSRLHIRDCELDLLPLPNRTALLSLVLLSGNHVLPSPDRCRIGSRCDCQPRHQGTTTGSQ